MEQINLNNADKLINMCCIAIKSLLDASKKDNFKLNNFNFYDYVSYLANIYDKDFYNGNLLNHLNILDFEAKKYLNYLTEKEIENFDNERMIDLNER